MIRFAPFVMMLPLAACGLQMPQLGRNGPDAAREPAPAVIARVAGEDTPRPALRPGAVPGDGGGAEAGSGASTGALGTTLATLGDASVRGLWIETSLVQTRQRGRVTAQNGATVVLELIPSGGILGSGSRLSLQAMQALGLPLTAVAEVSVEAL